MRCQSVAKHSCRRLDGNPSSLQRSASDEVLTAFSHLITFMLRIAAIDCERLSGLTHVMLPSRRCLKTDQLGSTVTL